MDGFDGSDYSLCEADDNITVVDAVTTDLCNETWNLTDDAGDATGVSCVQWSGKFKRNFSTGDTSGDLILDYETTSIQAHFTHYD